MSFDCKSRIDSESVEQERIPNFVHLHVHTDYSISESCATIEKLVAKAKELNMPALAITDSGNMFGVVEFERICRENGIKPIIGQEFYVVDEDREHSYHLILLCENQLGYKHLCRLSSFSYDDIYDGKPCISFGLLQQYHKGLICLSGGFHGEISQLLLAGKDELAEKIAQKYANLFNDGRYCIELQNHGIPEEKYTAEKLIALASKHNIPIVVTNDVHYVEREDAAAQDVLNCIGLGKRLCDEHKKLGGNQDLDSWYLKNKNEMYFLFPQYSDAYENTIRIADMCNVSVERCAGYEPIKNLLKSLPLLALPGKFDCRSKDKVKDQNDYLHHIVEEGLKNRYKEITIDIRERADYELNEIFKRSFSGYFLILWEIFDWGKSDWDYVNNRQKSVIPIWLGVGAVIGSLVAYALGITDIDPLSYGLKFEQFINLYMNMKENLFTAIYLDVDYDYREEVIQHLKDLYGAEKVGNNFTCFKLRWRRCIRSVGHVMGVPNDEIKEIEKIMPINSSTKLKSIFGEHGEKNPDIYARHQEFFDIAYRLEGIVHEATGRYGRGIVIGARPLEEICPVLKDGVSDKIFVQYSTYNLNSCGLVSFVFRGSIRLSAIRYAEELINKRREPGMQEFVAAEISKTDEKTFELFCNGDTDGVFMFDYPSIQVFLRELKPQKLDELIVLSALSTPRLMEHIPEYIKTRQYPKDVEESFYFSDVISGTVLAYRMAYIKAHYPDEFIEVVQMCG